MPTPTPLDLSSAEKVQTWAQLHEVQIQAWWATQHEWNAIVQRRVDSMHNRLWFIAGAATVGSAVGSRLIQSLIG